MDRRATPLAESKVPQVTILFWIIKIFATTLGETAGDALSMTLNLGYAVSTAIFAAVFAASVAAQVSAKRYHPLLYWLVIVATTTVGTTMADFADRSMGVGYVGGSIALFVLLMISLVIWYRSEGSISVARIDSKRVEIFYWVTILFSNTLGTALGDFLASGSGLGFEGASLIFAGLLALVAIAYFVTSIDRALLFWAAFILTRPFGATVGDLLTKPVAEGGLNLGRFSSSALICAIMIVLIVVSWRQMKAANTTEENGRADRISAGRRLPDAH